MKIKKLSVSLFKQDELNRKQLNTIYGGGTTGGGNSQTAGSGSGGGKDDTDDGNSVASRG
ncbi:TIGR04149 family rSAM-modified RiPP [Flavobacterium sp.]|uniref:TIGR04149 family rSAM-modified RiPP n=1 Tax=Flavobacterium sp. TaxID=239 RepID=UPI00261C5345|nr:TIGR04149 family rSAM-modified RiPP [Flavobacterium sp.]